MVKNIDVDDTEFVEVSAFLRHQGICLHIGAKDNEDSSYALVMNIREARQVVHAIHDAIRELKTK